MDPEGPEDGQDVEVDVPEGDVASLRTARDILDQILSAVDGGGEEPEMDVEEPEMDDEDPEALEEGDDEELNEIDQEELEVVERIAASCKENRRVTQKKVIILLDYAERT